ncbi:hypothetical protein F5Y18DRAFT_74425 [Xylariaceae sp. FL1019]|nr:hypothetical protein F5Y18DRAFT_74425 [Xylariaceae sp. FL1019]
MRPSFCDVWTKSEKGRARRSVFLLLFHLTRAAASGPFRRSRTPASRRLCQRPLVPIPVYRFFTAKYCLQIHSYRTSLEEQSIKFLLSVFKNSSQYDTLASFALGQLILHSQRTYSPCAYASALHRFDSRSTIWHDIHDIMGYLTVIEQRSTSAEITRRNPTSCSTFFRSQETCRSFSTQILWIQNQQSATLQLSVGHATTLLAQERTTSYTPLSHPITKTWRNAGSGTDREESTGEGGGR